MMEKLYTDRVYMCSSNSKFCATSDVLCRLQLLQLQTPVLCPRLPLPLIATMVKAMKGGKTAPKTAQTAMKTTAMKAAPMKTTAMKVAMPMKKPAATKGVKSGDHQQSQTCFVDVFYM